MHVLNMDVDCALFRTSMLPSLWLR